MRFPKKCLLVLTASIAASTGTASAQFGELAGFTESMQPEYHGRDLLIFAEALDLDKAQKDILKSLFEDYQTSFDAGLTEMQDRLRNMRGDLEIGDQTRILSMIFGPFEDWAKDRRKLGEELIVNVEGTLNTRQLEMVPAFRRQLLREKQLSRGLLNGESLNLMVIARQAGLGEPEMIVIQPILDEYALNLHDALVTRLTLFQDSQTKVIEALQARDGEKNLKLIDGQLAARVRVREVNDQYIELITLALPGEAAGNFHRKAMERGYPKAYRTTPAERMYNAAIRIRDLDPGIRQSIVDLQTLYLDDLNYWRDNLVEIIRDWEPKRERNRVEMYSAKMRDERPVKLQDPTISERRKREKLDDQYILLLQSLLTEEQFLALPGAERWLQRRNAKSRDRESEDPKVRQRQEIKRLKMERSRRGNGPGLGSDSGGGAGLGSGSKGDR